MKYEIGIRDPDWDKGFLTGNQREFLQSSGHGFENRRQYRARIRNNLRNTMIDLLYLNAMEQDDINQVFTPLAKVEQTELSDNVSWSLAHGRDLPDVDLTQVNPDTDPHDLATGWDMYMGLTTLLAAVTKALGPEIVKDMVEDSVHLKL